MGRDARTISKAGGSMTIIERETGHTLTEEQFEDMCTECRAYHGEGKTDVPCKGEWIECCDLVSVE